MTSGQRYIYTLIILVVGTLIAHSLIAILAVTSVDWLPILNALRRILAVQLVVIGGMYTFIRVGSGQTHRWQVIQGIWIVGLVAYFLARTIRLPAASLLTLTPAAASLGFWLMVRYSTITRLWVDLAVKVVTGWLVCAGFILVIDTSTWVDFPAYLAAGFVLLAYVVFAAHIHKALINPNGTQTLAAYWHAAAVIFWLIGGGVFGAALTVPNVANFVHGTRLTEFPVIISEFAVIALGLGLVNQIMADLRDENRRVTGLLPYWCLVGGWLLSLLAEFSYELILLHDPLLSPDGVRDFQAFALTIALVGAIIFALGIYARRIKFDET